MRSSTVLASLTLGLLAVAPAAAQLPDDYVEEPFLAGLDGPVGVAFDANGRAYVWERVGRVYVVENGTLVQPPLLDISDEVGSWRDFGMLGFALDPDFLANGLLYAYYVVDRHHLLYAGTSNYDPGKNEYFDATIGRITRFTADAAADFKTLVPGSRFVLLGETPASGVPILYESHGTGSLDFGADGTLLATSGDGANYGPVDSGSSAGTYWQQALADGIIRPEENVGAFRSQMLESLSGKVLRIDPLTGDGIPSNPFYDSADPRAHRSRVWALGLRNPFRFTVRPGTGSADPLLGDPGALYIGDVGWSRWEDLHVVHGPGENLGWPLFEGLTRQQAYTAETTFNLDAPNPLFGQPGCDQPYFTFQDLIRQEKANHNPNFPNPCDPDVDIPPGTPTFMHHRPALDWRHGPNVARVPIFVGNKGKASTLGDPDCPVEGDPFSGFCAVGGAWLSPPGSGGGFGDFSGTFLQMDFVSGWMRALRFDDEDRLEAVEEFGAFVTPVFAVEDPNDGSVLYVALDAGEVRRIRFTGSGNVAPQPVLERVLDSGSGVVAARFDASSSSDPEGEPLTFQWDFGDGASSVEPSPSHLFTNPGGQPAATTVTLTVTDPQGLASATSTVVQLDNTAPEVEITSFADGATYSTTDKTTLALDAAVSDAEHAGTELAYLWQVWLHHDTHSHPEEPIADPSSTIVLTPTPCNGSFYAYRVELTVTDPLGAATTVRRWLHPDCDAGTSVTLSAPDPSARLLPGQESLVVADVVGPAERVNFQVDGQPLASVLAPPFEAAWTPASPGAHTLSALVHTPDGTAASSPGLAIEVATPERLEVAVARVSDDGTQGPDGQVALDGAKLGLGAGNTSAVRVPLFVPQGATIVSARLELTADGAADAVTAVEIAAEAADDAPVLELRPWNLSRRPRTVARAVWPVEPWIYPLASGARQRSPELKDVLQEVVDRPGWAEGGWLVLVLRASGDRTARAFEMPDARPARLVVEFDTGG